MPKVRCGYCGNDVNFQGIGAICPHCGQLITAGSTRPQEDEIVDLIGQPAAQAPPDPQPATYELVDEPLPQPQHPVAPPEQYQQQHEQAEEEEKEEEPSRV